ncbi:MAG: GumC family protein [Candidatus Methylomirabilia bacterium]
MIRTEDYKRELVSIIFAQKHLIFWTVIGVFAGAALIALFWPPVYGSSASVILAAKQLAERNPEALEKGLTKAFEVKKEDIASEIEIMKSPEVVTKAVLALSGKYPALAHGEVRAGVPGGVHEVIGNLRTSVVPGSNVITIEYLNKNAQLAVDLLNSLLDEYLGQREKYYPRHPQPPARILEDQTERYRAAINEKEDELLRLINETGAASPEQELGLNLVLVKELEKTLAQLKNDYVDAKLTAEQVAKVLASDEIQYYSFMDNQIIKEVGITLSNLHTERGNLLRVYQPTAAVVVALDEQIRDNLKTMRTEAANILKMHQKKFEVLGLQVKNIEAKIDSYNDKNIALEEQKVLSQRLMRDADIMKSSLDTYAKRTDEVVLNGLISPDEPAVTVKVINRAFPSSGPVFPKKNVVIPLGLLVGLLTGVSFGFVREYFDHTFKKPSDVVAYAGLPVLFSLSRPRKMSFDAIYAVAIVLLIAGVALFVLLNAQVK